VIYSLRRLAHSSTNFYRGGIWPQFLKQSSLTHSVFETKQRIGNLLHHLIKSYDVASKCITFFDCSVSDAIYKRKLKFLTKLQHQKTLYANCLEKYILGIGYCTQTLLVKLFKFFVCLLLFFGLPCTGE